MESSRSRRWLSAGLVAVAGGSIAVALLGPLATGAIRYRVGETLRHQTIGLDLVATVVVAPLALVAARLVLRRHLAGPPLAAGIGAYIAYMFLQYIVGPDYAHAAGNNERLFPLALLLFALGWAVALAGWNGSDADALAPSPRRARLLGRLVLPLLALVAFGRYVPALADWTSSRPTDRSYLAGPGFSWTIATLDLGVFAPLTAVACVGAARGRPWAAKALFTAVTWLGLVGTAVASMAVTMAVAGDPAGSTVDAIGMSALGAAFALVAVWAYRPLFPRRHPGRRPLSRRARIAVAAVAGAVAAGAGFGGSGLLTDAERLGVKTAWLEGSPFPDYRVPGVVLLVVIGGGMAVTAAAALARSSRAGPAAAAMGVILLVWGAVETVTIGYRGVAQVVLLLVWVVAPALPLIGVGWRTRR